MYEDVKASVINPIKYRNRYIPANYSVEQMNEARDEARMDEKSLCCDYCPFRAAEHGRCSCGHVDKEDRLPDWAGGQNLCLRYAIERKGLSGWIQPSGDPFIITKEAAASIAEALKKCGHL